ncbi:HAMP domain-containing histidine kinase [Phycicoccus endophyticus]|uniref:histidine kinase n=1 Tax=Phycicoccus endophyticus TaxID=1690220 RepID=A0A7G9R261_9MICO|nr:HAMP domain-containing sensor histidine kinase [Phycicoccus endophyticus]NHI19663.1 HAMP domain-containing histidine kinase [Phycicoccus endophyticus]QNN49686.1 HAMP domain-containing histidine kinase [Phycicoccus endophyticus]GGL34107.1 two-component sensor histidine kinase [Phycicoccus endophyticus]
MGRSPRTPPRLLHRLEAVPLRTRLLLIVGLLVGAALLLTSMVTAYLLKSDLDARVDAELRSVLNPVATQAIADLQNRSDQTLPTSYAFVLQSGGGQVTRLPEDQSAEPDLPLLDPTDARVRTQQPFTVGSQGSAVQWRFIAARVADSNAVVAVGAPLEPVSHTVTRLLVSTGLLGTAALVLSVVLGHFAVRRAFRPLRRIEDTAAAIAAGDLTQRVPVRQADDEVTSLSRSLNAMLAQVESSFAVREASEERMRQFVADASHELRTPLATVHGYAELYRQGAVRDGEEVGAAMERIEAESDRMSALVEDLLTLARLDEEPEVEPSDVDLTVLAADAVADARARAPERRIALVGLGGPVEPTPVLGSEPRLRQVVTNLVANALRHTPAGTPVEVAVGTQEGQACLEVRDHGDGVPPHIATRVFERFFRADPSRGRGAGGGTGLGLAIVAAIVAGHHGRVGVAETPGGGATFVVRFPQRTLSR